jgi:hemolysin activation/secretion protein
VSRAGASNDWSKLELGISYGYKTKSWLYAADLKYSTTSDRLITGEQFAVGGATSLRGLNERELRGDEGYLLNLQAWAPPITKTLRGLAFIDIARIENNRPTNGEYSSENVSSVGLMVNWNPSSKISASASYGYLIDGIDEASDPSTASLDGYGKLHFNFSYRF